MKTVGKSAFEGCAKLKAVKGGAGIVTMLSPYSKVRNINFQTALSQLPQAKYLINGTKALRELKLMSTQIQ